MKRRRLSDLYVRGTDVTINDGGDEPVTVWIAKLNEVDRASVVRRSNAAKGKFMLEADDDTSETYLAVFGQVRLLEKEDVVSVIVRDEATKARQRIEAQVAGDEETWAKDGYLQSLLDAWFGDEGDGTGGLAEAQAQDPDDPEAKRVHAELQRYDDEVTKRFRDEDEALRQQWTDMAEDELWRKATRRALEGRGDTVFFEEYERQLLFYCVRDPEERSKRYFGTLAEIDDLATPVRDQLLAAYNRIAVEPAEGKDSRASQPSSSSSESSADQTPEPSGLAAASA